MLQYGVDIADEENIPVWLEASLEGHNLYKKFGFHDAESFTLDLNKIGGEGERPIFGMLRLPTQN